MSVIKVPAQIDVHLIYQIFIKYALRCAVVKNKHTQRDGVEWNNKANAKKAKN